MTRVTRLLPMMVLVPMLALVLFIAPSAGAHRSISLRAYAGYCLSRIIDKEDPRWNPRQWNIGGSGAYGLPQALPARKMRSAGRDWKTNPYTQIRWMRGYTRGRYGSPCAALRYHEVHGTY